MVARMMIVSVPIFAVTFVPDIFDLAERFGFLPVEFLKKALIDLFAVCMLTIGIDLQSLVNQVLFCPHYISNISQRSCVIRRAVDMNMDTAGIICDCPASSKISYDLLYHGNIIVGADRSYEFNGKI